jgi:hypothetical protein
MDCHVPEDPLEFLETQREFSETCFGSPGPWTLPGLQPHAVAMPLDSLGDFPPDKNKVLSFIVLPFLEI